MEEDIKILEEYLDKQDRKFVSEHRLMILQAAENIIARYKELEELLEEKTLRIGFENKDNYIPKSKIEEKIDELREIHKERDFTNKEAYYLDCYKELLED